MSESAVPPIPGALRMMSYDLPPHKSAKMLSVVEWWSPMEPDAGLVKQVR